MDDGYWVGGKPLELLCQQERDVSAYCCHGAATRLHVSTQNVVWHETLEERVIPRRQPQHPRGSNYVAVPPVIPLDIYRCSGCDDDGQSTCLLSNRDRTRRHVEPQIPVMNAPTPSRAPARQLYSVPCARTHRWQKLRMDEANHIAISSTTATVTAGRPRGAGTEQTQPTSFVLGRRGG